MTKNPALFLDLRKGHGADKAHEAGFKGAQLLISVPGISKSLETYVCLDFSETAKKSEPILYVKP